MNTVFDTTTADGSPVRLAIPPGDIVRIGRGPASAPVAAIPPPEVVPCGILVLEAMTRLGAREAVVASVVPFQGPGRGPGDGAVIFDCGNERVLYLRDRGRTVLRVVDLDLWDGLRADAACLDRLLGAIGPTVPTAPTEAQ